MSDSSRYQVLELLGRGGMGEVYRAQARGPHGFEKVVAIKRLRPDLARDSWFVDRLVREAKLLVSMQHSNLVGILDLGRTVDDLFLVLEYVDGPDLGTLLRAGRDRGEGPIPPGLATYVVHDACEGMAFAHERPEGAVIHADLSPANILLTRAGEVKVTDFGIARREGMRDRTGVIEGKWPYMSPEQATGERLTPRSDVFSMGVVLYEVLTERLPFDGETPEAIREALLGAIPPAPSAARSRLPGALDAICLRALARAPEDRFPSMRELAGALRAVSFDEGWREGAAELASLIGKWMPRRRPRTDHLTDVLAELGVGARRGAGTQKAPPDWSGTVVERKGPEREGALRWDLRAPLRKAARRRTWALAGAATIGLAATGYGLAVWQRAAARPATPPQNAVVAPAPAQDAPASPSAAPAVAPDAAPSSVAEAPAPVPAAPEWGTIKIRTEPWAYVWVDGKKTGQATPATLRLSPGEHRLTLRNPQKRLAGQRTVGVRAGQSQVIKVRLEPEP